MPSGIIVRSPRFHYITFRNSTKTKVYQDLINWVMENAEKYHVVNIISKEAPGAYELLVRYRFRGPKFRIVLQFPGKTSPG